jgi:peptidoglycan/LPS O-acetylase OafA/YrhL
MMQLPLDRARGIVTSFEQFIHDNKIVPLQPHLSHPKYRPDIDGLRAVAVLSVVAFHAFPRWVKGGFIGVDVFFVISGFLISTIIFENLDKGTFSFTEFYARRIKRIFPALLLVLVASYTFGWFVLLADEYKQLGKHIAAGAGFVSNFVLWNEAGYFDNSAETKPLLHLWSLGIEEQFYIVWPLLLWFAWKRRFNLLPVTMLVALISFYLNVKGVQKNAVATFYSPQTRFWELMCGSLLAWLTLYKKGVFALIKAKINGLLASVVYRKSLEDDGKTLANTLSFVGLLFLAYGFYRINNDFSFPGTWAIVPVLGTVLIISGGPKAWVNRVVLSNRLAVWFGLISFPLYLWHWPLLSFARIIASDVPSRTIRIDVIVLSVLLACLTYMLVERPIRLGKHNKVEIVTLALLMIVVGYIGYNTYEMEGLSFRSVIQDNVSIKTGYDGGDGGVMVPDCGVADEALKARFLMCAQDNRGNIKYALLGDSKAAAMYPGLVRTSTNSGRWLFIGGTSVSGTPVPVISTNEIYKYHQPLIVGAFEAIAKNPTVEKVVLVTSTRGLFQLPNANDKDIEDLPQSRNFEAAFEGLGTTVKKFKEAGKKIVLVVDNPTLPHPEDCLNRRTGMGIVNDWLVKENPKCALSLERHRLLSAKYQELLEKVRSLYPNDVKIFDPTSHLCDVERGVCTHRMFGRFLYSYTDHISDFASGLIGKDLNRFLESY